jgi:hypothetical protein
MAAAATNSQPAATKRPTLPPEEQFWQRYSPHNEFPLSSVGSLTIYLLIAVLIVASIKLGLFETQKAPLEVDAVEIGLGDEGGGGGDEAGVQGGVGQTLPDKISGVAKVNDNLPPLPAFNLPKPKLEDSKLSDLIPRDNDQQGAITEYTEAMGQLAKLEKETQDKLIRSLGQGGPGSGGGKGAGVGKGIGDGKGDGNRGTMEQRAKRMLRWNMVFDTRHGEDYRLQLQSLGAILAIPAGKGPDGQQQFFVIRDLRPGVKLPDKPEDLTSIKRIFWVDGRPESIGPLAKALGLREMPQAVVAFFPGEFEDKLATLERNFAQSHGTAVARVQETRFRIVFNGRSGKYEPMLVDQR